MTTTKHTDEYREIDNDLRKTRVNTADFNRVVERLCTYCGFKVGQFGIMDPVLKMELAGGVFNVDQRHHLEYLTTYFRDDPRIPHVLASPVGIPININDTPLSLTERQHRVFHDFLPRFNIVHQVFLIVRMDTDVLSIFFFAHDQSDSPDHALNARLNDFIPALKAVTDQFVEETKQRRHNNEAAAVLELIQAPVVVLDSLLRPTAMNAAAKSHFALQDLADMNHSVTLTTQVKEGAERMQDEELQSLILADGDVRYLLLRNAPMIGRGVYNEQTMPQSLTLVILSEYHPTDQRVEALQRLFNLSRVEAHLSVALCNGVKLNDYADARSVSPETVRTQLKSVYRKTNTNAQAALVALLSQILLWH